MRYYIIMKETISIMTDEKGVILVPNSNPNFNKIRDLILNNADINDEEIIALTDYKESIKKFSDGLITIEENLETESLQFFYKGEPINNSLTKRILTIYEQKGNLKPFLNFYHNLKANPNNESIEDLYRFLEANSLPITEDGCFLAYKAVTSDFKDIYTHSINNSIGSKPWMERKYVDNNRNKTCSTGFHFASYDYAIEYAQSYGNKNILIIVKINPKDVVSIPTDYNNAKGRCNTYEVITVIPENKPILKEYYEDESKIFDDEEDHKEIIEDFGEEFRDEQDILKKSFEDYSIEDFIEIMKKEPDKFKAVVMLSNGVEKKGFKLDIEGDDYKKPLTLIKTYCDFMEDYLVKYLLNHEKISFAKIKNRNKAVTKGYPIVLVYSIHEKMQSKFYVYTPKISSIQRGMK